MALTVNALGVLWPASRLLRRAEEHRMSRFQVEVKYFLFRFDGYCQIGGVGVAIAGRNLGLGLGTNRLFSKPFAAVDRDPIFAGPRTVFSPCAYYSVFAVRTEGSHS